MKWTTSSIFPFFSVSYRSWAAQCTMIYKIIIEHRATAPLLMHEYLFISKWINILFWDAGDVVMNAKACNRVWLHATNRRTEIETRRVRAIFRSSVSTFDRNFHENYKWHIKKTRRKIERRRTRRKKKYPDSGFFPWLIFISATGGRRSSSEIVMVVFKQHPVKWHLHTLDLLFAPAHTSLCHPPTITWPARAYWMRSRV